MRFHLLGLVHLPASKNYMGCAFTQKNIKLAKMLMDLGHEVIYYGAEGSTIACSKFVQTHTLSDICKEWGDGDNRFEIGYDWHKGDFRHDFHKTRTETTKKFYREAIRHINCIKKPDDFLLITQGYYHKPIADAVKLYLTCEPGIGYRGSYCNFRAFESAYIQNFTYGSQHPYKCINGNYYDRVIPNYFDEEDVEFNPGTTKDYMLFVGRVIKLKGVMTACLTANALKKKLLIVGQGGSIKSDGSLTNQYGDFNMPAGTWEYVGYADVTKRKELMKNAICSFAPTEYLECFGGVHIEAMLHGTPVLTTDFGVYPGTVIDGVNGYRCSTLNDFVEAGEKIGKLNRTQVRRSAEKYLSPNVAKLYTKWFDDLYQVYLSTTDKNIKGWHFIKEGNNDKNS